MGFCLLDLYVDAIFERRDLAKPLRFYGDVGIFYPFDGSEEVFGFLWIFAGYNGFLEAWA